MEFAESGRRHAKNVLLMYEQIVNLVKHINNLFEQISNSYKTLSAF